MAKVCTGCGLSSDAAGNLVVDTNDATWPYAACKDSSGAPVFCSTDGALRVGPRPRSMVINTGVHDFLAGSPDVKLNEGDLVTLGTFTWNASNSINPCLSAISDVRVILDFDLTIPPGVRVRLYSSTAEGQIFDFSNRGSANVTDMGWNVPLYWPATLLAPGANSNPSITITGIATGGDASSAKVQYSVTGSVIGIDT